MRLVSTALALTLLAAVPLRAAAQVPGGRGRAFAEKHGLPVRVVQAGPAHRRVRREIVPLLSTEAITAFHETFGTRGGQGVTLTFDGNHHLVMSLEPGDYYLYARLNREVRGYYGMHRPGIGRMLALRLDGLDHLRGWLGQRAVPGDRLYCTGNCMEWLPNAEVAPGTMLFHALGLSRSRDGRNMRAKLVHAANDRVDVIGVHVSSVEQFESMTDAELLGPAPAGGVDDSARE